MEKTAVRSRKSLNDLFPDSPSDALDLLNKLLQFNPDKRITAEEALTHPYLSKFHNPSQELELTYDVVPPVDDDVQLSVAEYRTKLYEVAYYFFIIIMEFWLKVNFKNAIFNNNHFEIILLLLNKFDNFYHF